MWSTENAENGGKEEKSGENAILNERYENSPDS